MPRTPQRSILGRFAAAILAALFGSSAEPNDRTSTSSSDRSPPAQDSMSAYWEGVASDPIDYEDSVENLETVEDDELLG